MEPIRSFSDLGKLVKSIEDDPAMQEIYKESGFLQDRIRYAATKFMEGNKEPCSLEEMRHLLSVRGGYPFACRIHERVVGSHLPCVCIRQRIISVYVDCFRD
jgi:hypothetical protein